VVWGKGDVAAPHTTSISSPPPTVSSDTTADAVPAVGGGTVDVAAPLPPLHHLHGEATA
jgi:hypothetical protein